MPKVNARRAKPRRAGIRRSCCGRRWMTSPATAASVRHRHAIPSLKCGRPQHRIAPPGRSAQQQERKATGTRTTSELIAAARRLPGGDLPWLYIDEDGSETDPRAQIERLMADEERRARAAAQPAGAAANAGLGEGDRAGDGTRPLGRGGPAAATLTPGAEMMLPDQAANDGRRIRIELPPDVALSEVVPPMARSAGEWRRVQEQAIERSALAAEGRKVVGRYFMRSAGGRGP
jgi:hypothetical protein